MSVPWTPFVEVVVTSKMEKVIGEVANQTIDARQQQIGVWQNNKYMVSMFAYEKGVAIPSAFGELLKLWPHKMLHLSIKRIDKRAVHDWRDLQRIKNEFVGEDAEAIEVYPAEDRLIDTANQYHLFAFPPGFRLPFGLHSARAVTEGNACGVRQRSWHPDERPADCVTLNTPDEVREWINERLHRSARP